MTFLPDPSDLATESGIRRALEQARALQDTWYGIDPGDEDQAGPQSNIDIDDDDNKSTYSTRDQSNKQNNNHNS